MIIIYPHRTLFGYPQNLFSITDPCGRNDAPNNCCDQGEPGDGQCGVGEGDCDNDDGCAPGLKCGRRNCPAGMPSSHDCCYKPSKISFLFKWLLFSVTKCLFNIIIVNNKELGIKGPMSCLKEIVSELIF
jgi:hypothetical protein